MTPIPSKPALTFAAASAQVDSYVSQFKEGYFAPLLLVARLSEELGEVARVVAHQNGKIPKAGEDVGDLELELADALFVMLCMTNSAGLSLEDGFERMMHKVETRDAERWTKKELPLVMPLAAAPTTDARYPLGMMPELAAVSAAQRQEAVQAIQRLPSQLSVAVSDLSEAQLDTPYRQGGWSVRQVVHHLADSHINAYVRTKWALTEANPTLKLYDEGAWAEWPDSELPVEVSLQLLGSLHQRWVTLLSSLNEAQWARTLVHPLSGEVISLTQMAVRYQWHGQHHTAHIRQLRAERQW